jgi:hypothetical protein
MLGLEAEGNKSYGIMAAAPKDVGVARKYESEFPVMIIESEDPHPEVS